MHCSRRRFVSTGAAAFGVLGGCLDTDDDSTPNGDEPSSIAYETAQFAAPSGGARWSDEEMPIGYLRRLESTDEVETLSDHADVDARRSEEVDSNSKTAQSSVARAHSRLTTAISRNCTHRPHSSA